MIIKRLVSSLLESNTFIVEKGEEVLIIDCGCLLKDVKNEIGNKKVVGVLLTHGHFDHSAYCNVYANEFGCKIYANKNIKNTMTDKIAIYSEDYSTIENFDNFVFLNEDDKLILGKFEVKYYSFSGHSPCCEGYLIEDNFFVGDFLFEKSFGRVDLKNGDKTDMVKSLDKIENLNFKNVFSGHGENSTKQDQLKHFAVFKKFLSR